MAAERGRASRRSTTGCATGASRASATGAPDPGRLLRGVRHRPGAGERAAGAAAGRRRLPPEGQAAARVERGLHQRRVPDVRRAGAARGGHDGHVRRLVLVLPALLRPAQRPGAVRAAARRRVDADRPVHRRHRPREGAPALLALLRQGDERLGDARFPRAVPAPVPPGLGDARRQEDVEVAGQACRPTSWSTSSAPTRSGSTSSSRAPPTRTSTGRRTGSSRWCGSCAVSGASCTRRRPSRSRRRESIRRSRARRTRRSRASPTTSSAGSSSTRRSRR